MDFKQEVSISMYLSRVKIDTENRKKIKDLNHLGAYHHWVEESFPDEINKNKRSRKLWRVDYLQGEQYLLLVSSDKPNLVKLETYGVSGSAESKDYNRLLNHLEDDDRLRFRVKLNPIKSLSSGKASGKRGRIIPLVTDEQQRKFLLDRSDKNGFFIEEDEFIIVNKGFEILKRRGKELKVASVTYEGILKISDLTKFKEILVTGFGKKKAYGFGLLTVIPEG